MNMKVFSVFDEKAKVFSPPFFMPHNGQAMREFGDLATNKDTVIAKHPSDYKLYCLAEFDNVSGGFVGLPQPEFLAHASDFIDINSAVLSKGV